MFPRGVAWTRTSKRVGALVEGVAGVALRAGRPRAAATNRSVRARRRRGGTRSSPAWSEWKRECGDVDRAQHAAAGRRSRPSAPAVSIVQSNSSMGPTLPAASTARTSKVCGAVVQALRRSCGEPHGSNSTATIRVDAAEEVGAGLVEADGERGRVVVAERVGLSRDGGAGRRAVDAPRAGDVIRDVARRVDGADVEGVRAVVEARVGLRRLAGDEAGRRCRVDGGTRSSRRGIGGAEAELRGPGGDRPLGARVERDGRVGDVDCPDPRVRGDVAGVVRGLHGERMRALVQVGVCLRARVAVGERPRVELARRAPPRGPRRSNVKSASVLVGERGRARRRSSTADAVESTVHSYASTGPVLPTASVARDLEAVLALR